MAPTRRERPAAPLAAGARRRRGRRHRASPAVRPRPATTPAARRRSLERALRRPSRRAGLGGSRAAGRPLARRHPHLLPVLGRAGDAARRHGPPRPAPAAARARDARRRRSPTSDLVADAGRPGPGDPRALPRDGPRGGAHRHRRPRASASRPRTVPGRHRRAQPGRPHPPAPAGRHRLEPHDRRQPAPLPARAPHRRSPSGSSGYGRRSHAGRSATSSCASTSRARWPTSVVYASVFGAVLASLRSLRHQAGRVRHRGRRPHRRARRPGRRALRRPARRRHRHQPGPGLLPGPGRAARARRCWCSSATCTRAAIARSCCAGRRRSSTPGVTSWSRCWPCSDAGAPVYDAEHAAALAGSASPRSPAPPTCSPT